MNGWSATGGATHVHAGTIINPGILLIIVARVKGPSVGYRGCSGMKALLSGKFFYGILDMRTHVFKGIEDAEIG